MGDVDQTLRMMMQRMAEDVGSALAPGQRVASAARPEWLGSETQLVRGELRLDRLFPLRVGGELRLLHIELQLRVDSTMADRMAEYDGVLRMTARRNGAQPSQLLPVVILLDGPPSADKGWVDADIGWPEEGRLSPRYYQEPVYLRLADELLRRGCWWWVFVPLTRDCDLERIEQTLVALREHVPHDLMRAELLAAMRIFAERREQNDAVTGWSEPIRREMETMSTSSSNWMAELPFGKELIAQAEARTEARVRRADLLRIAERVLGTRVRQQLADIEDLDALEREVVARLRPANDDAV